MKNRVSLWNTFEWTKMCPKEHRYGDGLNEDWKEMARVSNVIDGEDRIV